MQTETRHSGEHILSEAAGSRSREQGVLASGNNLEAGTVLGVITASGLWTALDEGASDGSEVAAGVLMDNVDASAADTAAVAHVRDCEVDGNALTWPDGISAGDQETATGQLAAAGIIVR